MPIPLPTADNCAVVTGASSGIGMALATELASRGYSLILVARRGDILTDLAVELESRHDVTAEVHAADLSNPTMVADLCAVLAARDVAILCNNAGVATFGPLSDQDADYEQAIVRLNANAVHSLALSVLPQMLARNSGGILNVGSAAGNMPIPNNATYAATKAFVNSFSESLRGECLGAGVHVTLLAPGPVRTEAADPTEASTFERNIPEFLWNTSEYVAKSALDALSKNKMRVVPGALSKAMSVAGGYSPRKVTAPIIGRFYKNLAD